MVNYPCIEMFPSGSNADSRVMRAIFEKNSVWRSGTSGRITITFGKNNCVGCSTTDAWSYVGTAAGKESPGMNLGYIDPPFESFVFNGQKYDYEDFKYEKRNYCDNPVDRRTCRDKWIPGSTVIHEFCHSLGMLHEHQNNLFKSNDIKLNKPAIINHYMRIGLGASAAESNVIQRYSCENDTCEYEGSAFDPESIMLYALLDEWVIGKNPTHPNFKLSAIDKEWLTKQYPISSNNMPRLTYHFIDVDEPMWKRAWVCKMIMETFLPFLGVKFTFIDNDNRVITLSPIENPDLPISENLHNQELQDSDEVEKMYYYKQECGRVSCTGNKCIEKCKYVETTKPPAHNLIVENFASDKENRNIILIVISVIIALCILFLAYTNRTFLKRQLVLLGQKIKKRQ